MSGLSERLSVSGLSERLPSLPKWTVLRYKFYPRTRDQQLIFVTLLFTLLIAVVLPIGTIVYYSFAKNFPVLGTYSFTVEHYAEFFADPGLIVDITIDSFVYAGGATAMGLVIGTTAAIYTVKYLGDTKLQLFMIIPYGIPSVAALTGWILLLGNAGLLTKITMSVFDLAQAPWDIRSMAGMIWVEGIHIAPVAFLLVLPAISAVPAAMDEASFISGAGRIKTLRKIVLPVIWPTILSTFIFLFVRTMATVATPSVLGVPDQIYTFGSAIPFLFLSGTSLSYSKALSFSVILTCISGAFILLYLRVQAREGRYTTVIGQGQQQPKQYASSNLHRWVGVSLFAGYIVVAGLLPLGAIVWDSLLPATTLQLQPNIAQFTLDNYVALFNGNANGVVAWWRALRNTLILALVVPTTTMLIALLIAYSNQSIKMPLAGLLSFLAAVPLAIPGVARGMGFLAAFIRSPIYGTFWILLVAFHGMTIPIAMRYASPALTRLSHENTEASIISGANVIRSFRKITLPLVSDDYIMGWMHMFVGVTRNVAIPVLLYSAGSEVVAVELLNVLRAGYSKTASTLAVVITVISLVPYIVLQYRRISRKEKAREGHN